MILETNYASQAQLAQQDIMIHLKAYNCFQTGLQQEKKSLIHKERPKDAK